MYTYEKCDIILCDGILVVRRLPILTRRRNKVDRFKLVTPYKPTGDQPKAIKELTEGILKGYKNQTLLAVT